MGPLPYLIQMGCLALAFVLALVQFGVALSITIKEHRVRPFGACIHAMVVSAYLCTYVYFHRQRLRFTKTISDVAILAGLGVWGVVASWWFAKVAIGTTIVLFGTALYEMTYIQKFGYESDRWYMSMWDLARERKTEESGSSAS